MWRLTWAALFASSCFGAESPDKQPHIFVAKIDHVVDGDSVVVVVEKEKISVRMEGVDAPEPRQAFGGNAKNALERALPKDAQVVMEDMGQDKYGRMLAIVHRREFSNEPISKYLLKHGYAWHFSKYNKNADFAKAQELAKSKRRGIWADSDKLVAPWDYRIKQDRGEVMDQKKVHKPTASFYKRQQSLKFTRWLNRDSGERHTVSCRHADHGRGRPCTGGDGMSCKVCGG